MTCLLSVIPQEAFGLELIGSFVDAGDYDVVLLAQCLKLPHEVGDSIFRGDCSVDQTSKSISWRRLHVCGAFTFPSRKSADGTIARSVDHDSGFFIQRSAN